MIIMLWLCMGNCLDDAAVGAIAARNEKLMDMRVYLS